MALQMGTLTRVDETNWLRWGHIDRERRCVQVLGTKTQSAVRATILPNALLPWLEEADRVWRLGRGPALGPMDFVLRTRMSARREAVSKSTLGRRVLDVLVIAGVKNTRSTTHVWRKTGMTILDHSGVIREQELQVMAGHKRDRRLLDRYISPRWAFSEAWAAVMDIPTPEEVRARAEEIASQPDWVFPTPQQVREMKAELGCIR